MYVVGPFIRMMQVEFWPVSRLLNGRTRTATWTDSTDMAANSYTSALRWRRN